MVKAVERTDADRSAGAVGSAKKRGESTERAEEIAARTVSKERARSGEPRTASRTSAKGPKSASQRGGERPHQGAQGRTKDPLRAEAGRKNDKGRSSMDRAEPAKAVGR
ncbi:plasmid stabilization protein [Streptomyces sp. HUAS MG91]|uniref:Plasmid stabilization protein n=1 Tax=Streptomyces tabacisoli TaxID=3156398 RepID=A0AAU8J4W4_9ACTN